MTQSSERAKESQITVIGGGIAGLVGAISAAEAGAPVRLLEAHRQLGGRARCDDGQFVANFGPHALYKGLSNWHWLKGRDLLGRVITPPSSGVRFYLKGRPRRMLPAGLLRSLPLAFAKAPAEQDFRSWASASVGERNADMLCAYAGVITFHHDPGSLSAAFVAERFRWVYVPPVIRFLEGGWSKLVDRLQVRALDLGVQIETGVRVQELPAPPVIVATELAQARELLADETLSWHGATAVLLDLGLRRARRDPAAVVDLEQGALIERYSARDSTVAPPGHELIQAHIGIDGSEDADRGVARIEQVMDNTFRDWRNRTVWRRRQLSSDRTGAVDPPGFSWTDRPSIDRGGGVFLAGDMVRAPGFLSEVSFSSALQAADLALAWQTQAALSTKATELRALT